MPAVRRTSGSLSSAAAEKLRQAGVPEPEASAEVLLSELLGMRRSEASLYDGPLTDEHAAVYGAWISRRGSREPVQRILGKAYFRNLTLNLSDSTLVPRADTESVVEAVLERIDRRGFGRVLDVGTGSGAIAISVSQERPSCEVHATDLSEAALRTARHNADRAGAGVRFHAADLLHGLDKLRGGVDLLVSNPPYVRTADLVGLDPEVRAWDPAAALDGGPDGLAFYRRIFREAPPLLSRGAELVLEVGDGQAAEVLGLGEAAGYPPLGTYPDLTGTTRAVLLGRP
ncbi:MAG: peptide chain release factor N(5)-glutamine methyltransferase [Rubrobacter sp.]|nr:peptide chain release factor N(5)-glutamine methyltransferase [Rubrobacter sp.]